MNKLTDADIEQACRQARNLGYDDAAGRNAKTVTLEGRKEAVYKAMMNAFGRNLWKYTTKEQRAEIERNYGGAFSEVKRKAANKYREELEKAAEYRSKEAQFKEAGYDFSTWTMLAEMSEKTAAHCLSLLSDESQYNYGIIDRKEYDVRFENKYGKI